MFTFKKYPPSFIPIMYWVDRVNKKGQCEYLVLPTVWNWIKEKMSKTFQRHFSK